MPFHSNTRLPIGAAFAQNGKLAIWPDYVASLYGLSFIAKRTAAVKIVSTKLHQAPQALGENCTVGQASCRIFALNGP